MGYSYRYIDFYARRLKLTPYSACLKLFGETEKVLQLILKPNEHSRESVKSNSTDDGPLSVSS